MKKGTASNRMILISQDEDKATSVQAKVLAIRAELEKIFNSGGTNFNGKVLELFQKLCELPMNWDILESTRIGMTVGQLRKSCNDKSVSLRGKSLIKEWTKLNPNTKQNKKDEPSSATGSTSISSMEKTMTRKNASRKPDEILSCSSHGYKKHKIESSIVGAERRIYSKHLLQTILVDGHLPDLSNDPKNLAKQLEQHIFQEFKNTKAKYIARVTSCVANLKDSKNPNLRLNLLLGNLSPERLAKMTSHEMASDELKDLRFQNLQQEIEKTILVSSQEKELFKCQKCIVWCGETGLYTDCVHGWKFD